MIIKVSPRRAESKFSNLAGYIADPNKKTEERVEEFWTNNFEGDVDDWDVASMMVDAKHKTKAGIDKDMTYHLIVSFTPEESERLKSEDYKDIASQVAESVGLGSHQRISAIHGDTKNKHMHLAIDLLDEKNRFKEPYKAFVALKEKRKELESQYGFKPPEKGDKDKGERTLSDANSKRENHSNLASFEGWLKDNVSEDLKKVINQEGTNWGGVHKSLKEKGVTIRKRGAGLVFSHETQKLFVKASAVDRQFSLKKMSDKLGQFTEAKGLGYIKAKITFKSHYVLSKELFAKYQKELKGLREMRTKDREGAKKEFAAEKAEISKDSKIFKEEVRKSDADPKVIVGHLKRLTFERSQKMEGAIEKQQTRLSEIKAKYKHQTWIQFLQVKAQEGDLTAIEALQRRGVDFQNPKNNQISNKDTWKPIGDSMRGLSCRVLGSGELVYQTKEKAEIRDKGARLIVGEKFDDKALEATLNLAVAKFGKTLHLNGSEEFQKAVRDKAEKMNLDVRFSDKEKTFQEKREEMEKRSKGKESGQR